MFIQFIKVWRSPAPRSTKYSSPSTSTNLLCFFLHSLRGWRQHRDGTQMLIQGLLVLFLCIRVGNDIGQRFFAPSPNHVGCFSLFAHSHVLHYALDTRVFGTMAHSG